MVRNPVHRRQLPCAVLHAIDTRFVSVVDRSIVQKCGEHRQHISWEMIRRSIFDTTANNVRFRSAHLGTRCMATKLGDG